ncbi:MAG TPA: hypothetical protein VHD33_08395, partial [Legionellaceae bacterium]|nr:hypothetical protein [Legionellaceae bacterium]
MLKVTILKIFVLFSLLMCPWSLWAQQDSPPIAAIVKEKPEFNPKEANKQFDQLKIRLSAERLNLEQLDNAIDVLQKFLNDANNCITQKQKKLSALDPLIDEATHSKDNTKGGADLLYLQQEQKKIANQLAQCRLFSIRAQEALNTYQATVTKIRQKQVLTRDLPIWTLFMHLQADTDKPAFASDLKFEMPSKISALILLGVLLISMVIATLFIVKIKSDALSQKVLSTKKIGISDGVLLSLCLLVSCAAIYFNVTALHPNTPSNQIIMHLSTVATYYLWALAFIIFTFKINMVTLFFYWYTLDSYFFRNLLIFLLTYYTLTIVGQFLIQAFTSNESISQFAQMVFLTGVLLTVIGFFYYFCYTHRHIGFIRKHRTFLQRSVALLFLTFGVLNLFGYYPLASHLTYAGISSFAILFLMVMGIYAIQKLYSLSMHSPNVRQHILHLFGYHSGKTIVEFIVLKTSLQIVLIFTGIYFIGQSWGYGAYYINKFYTELLNGVHVANVTFYPSRIMAGVFVFCGLYLLFRIISTKLSQHTQFEDEEETQVAVASIIIYIGF